MLPLLSTCVACHLLRTGPAETSVLKSRRQTLQLLALFIIKGRLFFAELLDDRQLEWRLSAWVCPALRPNTVAVRALTVATAAGAGRSDRGPQRSHEPEPEAARGGQQNSPAQLPSRSPAPTAATPTATHYSSHSFSRTPGPHPLVPHATLDLSQTGSELQVLPAPAST
jgi:hypothetical protein